MFSVDSEDDLFPGDRLCAILVFAQRKLGRKSVAFKARDYDLQRIFYRIDRQTRRGSGFVFSNSGPEPYSPQLEEDLTYLQFSGLTSRPDLQNPEILVLKPYTEDYFDKVLTRRLGESKLKKLEKIAGLFVNRISLLN